MVAWSIQLSQVHNSDMSDGLYLLEQAVFCLTYCLHMRLEYKDELLCCSVNMMGLLAVGPIHNSQQDM